MRFLSFICAIFLFVAIGDLPIGYYSFLRILIAIGAVGVIVYELDHTKEINFWIIVFGIIAVLFNPFVPIYFGNKELWMPIDLIAGLLFLTRSFVKR